MRSADHGELIFEQSFDHIIEKADFFQNPVSVSTSTFGAITTNTSVYGLRLSLQNSTHRSFKILGSRELDQKPTFMRAIKQKSSFKVMLYNDITDEMEIFSQDLSKRENSIPLNLGGD